MFHMAGCIRKVPAPGRCCGDASEGRLVSYRVDGELVNSRPQTEIPSASHPARRPHVCPFLTIVYGAIVS